MPSELRYDATLRKVVCVLVPGQLADIRHLLRVCFKEWNQRIIAKSFKDTTERVIETPSEKVIWLLKISFAVQTCLQAYFHLFKIVTENPKTDF